MFAATNCAVIINSQVVIHKHTLWRLAVKNQLIDAFCFDDQK